MPQIAHPTVIQGNRYYGGIFGQGGIGQAFLNPLVGAAAHEVGQMMGFTTPEDEAKQLQLDAAKRAEGQRAYLDFTGNRITPEQYRNKMEKLGYDIEADKADFMPSAEDELRNQMVLEISKGAGYDLSSHKYGDMGFSNTDNLISKQGNPSSPSTGGEEVPDFTVSKSSAPVTSGVVEAAHPPTSPTGVEPTSPTEELMNVGMRREEPKFEPSPVPLEANVNPIKVRPIESFNLNEFEQQGPQYVQQFLQPDDGTSQFNYKGLSRQQQQQAQVVSNRLLAASNMLKMYDSKEITKPEDLAKVNSMLRTTEKDVNQMVDWHNQTTTGDINKIRAMGGLPTLATDMKSLQMLSPAYIASVPKEQRPALEKAVRDITRRFQQLNPFELKVVAEFAGKLGDESTKMLFDYQKGLAQVGATDRQTQANVYSTNVKDAQDQRELYLKDIPGLELEAKKIFLKAHSDKINSDIAARNLGIEAAKVQQGYAKIANDLGIANNKNAVDLAAMEVTLRTSAAKNRVDMMGHTMRAMSADQKREQDMLLKVYANLGASKGLKDRLTAARDGQFDQDPKVRELASQTFKEVLQGGTGEAASLITQKAIDWKQLLPAFGIPLPVGVNPTDTAGKLSQVGAAEVMRRAATQVDEFLKNGQAPPLELLNLSKHLKVNSSGDAMLDSNAYKTAEDTTTTAEGLQVPKDQEILNVMAQQAKLYKTIPSYDAWLTSIVPTTHFKNQDLPGFKDPNTAKRYYNEMVDFHRRMNGQRK